MGMQDHFYNLGLTAQGGQPPYTWTVTPALPAGLQMNGPTIQGVPQGPSSTQLTITVQDTANPANTATKQITLTMLGQWGPYETPVSVTICQMDVSSADPATGKMLPSIDGVTGQPRCFVVPQPVAESSVRFMLAQTNGLDASGNVVYKFANWWDFILKDFLNAVVMPMIDQFPPPNVAQAKAQAAAAAAAVDAAKAAVMQGQQQ
jgi:hypothetical protein